MSRALLLVAAILAFGPGAASAANEGIIPDSSAALARIEIAGLDRTRPTVILRELSCRAGDRLDRARLEQDRLRLLDLDLFARLELAETVDSATGRPVLRIEARERPTRYLLPNLEYDEEDGFTYGSFGAELNLAGRAWRTALSSGWGARRYLHFSLGAPWIAGRRLPVGASFERSRSRNRGEEQREDRTTGSLSLAPTSGPRWRFPLDLGWERVDTRPDPPDSARAFRRDDHRWLGAGFRRDSRGSAARAIRGSVIGVRVVGHGGRLGGSTSLLRYEGDALRVQPTGGGSSLTVASRVAWSRGRVPSFLRLGLGGASTLRGTEPGRYRGESRWYGWVEERFPLVPTREYAIRGGRHTFDVTIDGAVFADAGSVWRGDALQRGEARAHWGGGAGLRVLLPLVSLLQVDVATDGRELFVHTLTGLRL